LTTIAVTGASGFIGRHVLAALAKHDVDVVAHGRRTPVPSASVSSRQHWVSFDLGDLPRDSFKRLHAPDILIHLAWGGLPNYSAQRHLEVELPIQGRFLRAMIESGLKRLVVSGTCFEYGMQSGCLREDMPTQPTTAYASAKDLLRRELEAAAVQPSLDLRWLRLFYLYGEGQAPTALYSLFRAAVARGDKRFDMSPGDQLRDFMPAEEAGAAIAAVAMAPRAPGIVNVCSGAPTTVRALVERWRSDLGSGIELNPGAMGYAAHEPFAFWGDNSRLARIVGESAASHEG
jgi:dTDP-6-deoxy-L-talose 4-dehydrogenase (NAD+)